LTAATILTLLFLPALYVLWFRVEEPLPQERSRGELGAAGSGQSAVAANLDSR